MRNLEVADCEVVVGVEAESLPATWHWWRVVWLFLLCDALLADVSVQLISVVLYTLSRYVYVYDVSATVGTTSVRLTV